MKRLLIGGAAAALVAGIAPAVAQTAPPPGVAQGTAPVAVAPPAPGVPRTHMMVMSDRVMTRDDVVKHVGKLFAKLDTNRDGVITREEVDALHQKMEHGMGMAKDMPKRLAERGIFVGDRGAMFDRLDKNRDGNISRQEFMAAEPRVHEERVMILRGGPDGAPGAPGAFKKMHMHGRGMGMRGFGGHIFEMADANHDGRLTLQEAQAGALAHFDKADLNHDGRITPEERRQVHETIRFEHRSG